MSPEVHSQISVKHWGGKIEDYYPIHFFMDSTKELCSDNRHRIFHTMWAVRRIIIPIFGKTLINSDGKKVNVKDLCEKDHILPDYANRFIPTLSDFVQAIDSENIDSWQEHIETIHHQYQHYVELRELMMSPLANTGNLASLLLTHNSWFLTEIAPRIFDIPVKLTSFAIAPSVFFEQMRFERWMDNGADIAPSAKKLKAIQLD